MLGIARIWAGRDSVEVGGKSSGAPDVGFEVSHPAPIGSDRKFAKLI
jgi:hypothetical protein